MRELTPEQEKTIKNSKLKIVCGTNFVRMQYCGLLSLAQTLENKFTDISFFKIQFFWSRNHGTS